MIYHLSAYHSGLGDWLQYSTLPEMLTRAGHTVHLWDKAEFRNAGARELILMNPYILPPIPGAEWNLGDIPGLAYKNDQRSFIANWEAMFGMVPENDLPKIYYQPKGDKIGQLKYCEFEGIIELSSHSHKYDHASVIANVREFILSRPDVKWTQITSDNQLGEVVIPELPKYKIRDIFHLCDVIANCKCFLSLQSGSQTLAAAIQRMNPHTEQFCILNTPDVHWIKESQKFIYPNIQYFSA